MQRGKEEFAVQISSGNRCDEKQAQQKSHGRVTARAQMLLVAVLANPAVAVLVPPFTGVLNGVHLSCSLEGWSSRAEGSDCYSLMESVTREMFDFQSHGVGM